jgi:hypothetical protein
MPITLGPNHWLERAQNARTVARWLANPEARRLLLEVAARYEQIAKLEANAPQPMPLGSSHPQSDMRVG